MVLGEVLEKIQGIDKNTISFYEKMGYIKPKRAKVGSVKRRVYSEHDFEMIRAIWRYHRQGYTPRAAHKRALQDVERKEKELDKEVRDLLRKADKRGAWKAAALRPGSVLPDSDVKRDLIKILKVLIEEE